MDELRKHIEAIGNLITNGQLSESEEAAILFVCGMALADLPPNEESPLTDILFGHN